MVGFVGVVHNFLGNRIAANFEEVVQNMLDAYQRLGANMSIKVSTSFLLTGNIGDD